MQTTNPYETLSHGHPPETTHVLNVASSPKRIAWNATLLCVGILLYADNFPRLFPKLTRLFSHQFVDIYAISSLASLLEFFLPCVVLFALSTAFFAQRRLAVRLFFLFPVPVILFDSIPPRISDTVTLLLYLAIVSSILYSGIGWPALARDRFIRFRNRRLQHGG